MTGKNSENRGDQGKVSTDKARAGGNGGSGIDRSGGSGDGRGEGAIEVRARFSDGGPFKSEFEDKSQPQTSPLLSSTPPTVAKSLIKSYPYLLIVNKLLSIITWTNDDCWINVVLVSGYAMGILYFEKLVTWFGHLIIVGFITLYALLNNKIIEETNMHPTLDDVVQALTTTCVKADMLLNPITQLSLSAYEIKRLLFTTVFLTPGYLIVTFLIITPRALLLISGLYILTYHSSYSRVTRKMLWKLKVVRLLCFYLTGLDFLKAKNHSLFAAAFAKVQKNAGHSLSLSNDAPNKPVRFTYVIYENQRRWLGIGWTANLLSYERTPWTDEFLNESSSIENFRLPNNENGDYTFEGADNTQALSPSGAHWRWVDKTWRVDLTNDGAITLPSGKRSKTTADPAPNEGYIYFDNTWKKPSTEDSYSKYTRRRRWIRTAELVFDDAKASPAPELETISSSSQASSPSTAKKRKSLRFADPDTESVASAASETTSIDTSIEKKTNFDLSANDAKNISNQEASDVTQDNPGESTPLTKKNE